MQISSHKAHLMFESSGISKNHYLERENFGQFNAARSISHRLPN